MEITNGVSPQMGNQYQSHDINSSDFYGKKPKKSKKSIVFGILGVVLALLIVGTFLYVISKKRDLKVLSPFSEHRDENQGSQEPLVVNPLTGIEYPQSQAQEWSNQRPMGFMINNYIDARPQSGLVYADLVYEIVAEGGITRFLAFYLSETPERVGPIRSTREYYLVLVKELGDSMLMHHGYSPQALEAIENWPVRSLQRGGADSDVYCPGCTWRDDTKNVATEHTLYSDGKALRKRAEELGWEGVGEFTVYKFKEDSPVTEEENVGEDPVIEINFWYEGDYSGIFKYYPQNNSYLRYNGFDEEGNPIETRDAETNEQVEIKNLIIQFVTEASIAGDDKNRLEYQLVGSGEGKVFIDGEVQDVTWVKEDRDNRTVFYTLDGNEFEFNRGKFWISIVPDRNVAQVTY